MMNHEDLEPLPESVVMNIALQMAESRLQAQPLQLAWVGVLETLRLLMHMAASHCYGQSALYSKN